MEVQKGITQVDRQWVRKWVLEELLDTAELGALEMEGNGPKQPLGRGVLPQQHLFWTLRGTTGHFRWTGGICLLSCLGFIIWYISTNVFLTEKMHL